MILIDLLAYACLGAGALFFFAGTLALLRFPDVYTRLHGLAKIDNLALGFTLIGLSLKSGDPYLALKLMLAWPLVLTASATVGFLIGRRARLRGIAPWRVGEPAR